MEDKNISQIFNLEIGGKEYTIEFTRESLKKADQIGVMSSNIGVLESITKVFYVGLLKHHEGITLKATNKIFDTMLDEGEYSLEDFNDTVVEEFTKLTSLVFTRKGKKKITSINNQVMD